MPRVKTKQAPLITVVTVCYNAEDNIEKTIRSVISQNYCNKEYVVIDGASTDATLKIIESFRNSINTFISEPDNGIYHAMNKAVSKSTGEWIIFMNAGDVFVDNTILKQVSDSLQKEVDVLYGDILVLKEGKHEVKEAPIEITHFHRMPFCHQAVFTRTALLKSFPFDEKYKLSADFKLYKQLKHEHVVFSRIPIPITIYDRTGISNSQRTKGLAENIAIIKEVDDWQQKLQLLPRLYFVKNWQTIRTLLKKKQTTTTQ